MTCTYGSTGAEQSFDVPAGVGSVSVTAVGAPGVDAGANGTGGAGAKVQATLAVTPGSTLYVEVGQTNYLDGGSFNGGGAPGYFTGGAGGGASDVRTVSGAQPGSLASRLLVAGGGGGAGDNPGFGGNGGDAGADGQSGNLSSSDGQGGSAGTATAGGAGGAAGTDGAAGGAGTLGQGGAGGHGSSANSGGGGGGGGGFYGGGGGGDGVDQFGPAVSAVDGGGGGGSNLVPTGGTATLDTTGTPQVVISYTDPNATAPGISGTPTSPATVNTAYDFRYTVTGEPTPTTMVTSGALPPGLTLSSAGEISGSPTAAGSYTFTVTATNGVQPDATTTNTIQVDTPPTITGTPTSPGQVGTSYDFTYTLGGQPTPTTSLTSGALPTGLTLSSSGEISGTPTAGGSYTFTVTASNGAQPDATSTNTIQVDQAPTITGTPRPGQVGEPYSFTFTTSGTPTPTESVTSGSLPPGLTLSSAGRLSGRPTKAGTYRFTVTASNGVQPDASDPVTLTVRPTPNLSVGDANTAEGNSGTKPLTFPVTLSSTSIVPVTVQWATANGSAKAPGDYRAASGTLTIPAGARTGHITVQIVGDRLREPNEVFYVLLHDATHAHISDPNASGGILNDD